MDEAHERSIHTDILIGLLKREIETSSSSNFRVVISSATLDSNKFSKFFHNAPIVKVSGRTFPVDVIHTRKRIQTRKSVIDAAIDTVIRISEEDVMGHVLLFLSGQNEIERMCRMLRQQRLDQVIILPLYGALRSDQQQDVFRDVPRNVRKVIVCTNIAETSITIPGIPPPVPISEVVLLFKSTTSKACAESRICRCLILLFFAVSLLIMLIS